MENGVVIFVVAVLIVAVMLLLAIKLTGKRNHKFNRDLGSRQVSFNPTRVKLTV